MDARPTCKHFLYQHAPCGPGPALTRLRGQQTPDKSAKHSGACPGTRCPSPPRAARRHHLLRQRWAMMLSRPASSSSAAGSQPIHRHIDRAELRRRERGPGPPFQLAEGGEARREPLEVWHEFFLYNHSQCALSGPSTVPQGPSSRFLPSPHHLSSSII